ncbi:hypothetical protein COCVIDRAFT_98558, partial [Bipolaris victoriae FI3]
PQPADNRPNPHPHPHPQPRLYPCIHTELHHVYIAHAGSRAFSSRDNPPNRAAHSACYAPASVRAPAPLSLPLTRP